MGWSYSGKLYRLKRRLASSTRRLISAVRSAFSHTIAPRYTKLVVCSYTSSAASVTKVALPYVWSSGTWSPSWLPNFGTTHTLQRYLPSSSQGCSSIWERYPRRLHTAFPRSIAAPPQSPGIYLAQSPASLPPLIPHIGAHRILHCICVGANSLHRHTQYGSKSYV